MTTLRISQGPRQGPANTVSIARQDLPASWPVINGSDTQANKVIMLPALTLDDRVHTWPADFTAILTMLAAASEDYFGATSTGDTLVVAIMPTMGRPEEDVDHVAEVTRILHDNGFDAEQN